MSSTATATTNNNNNRARSYSNETIVSRLASIAALQMAEPYSQVFYGQPPAYQPTPLTSRYPSSTTPSTPSLPGAYRVSGSNTYSRSLASRIIATALHSSVVTTTATPIPYTYGEPVTDVETQNNDQPETAEVILTDESDEEQIPIIYANSNPPDGQSRLLDSLDRLLLNRRN